MNRSAAEGDTEEYTAELTAIQSQMTALDTQFEILSAPQTPDRQIGQPETVHQSPIEWIMGGLPAAMLSLLSPIADGLLPDQSIMQSPGQPVIQSVVQPTADLNNQPVVQPATSEQTVTEPTTQPAVQTGECETGATVTQSAADLADQPASDTVSC